jgi:hypothetical protein
MEPGNPGDRRLCRPLSLIGPGAVVEGAEIENSILSQRHGQPFGWAPGGQHPAANAAVGRDFRLPRALRLKIGEGAEVARLVSRAEGSNRRRRSVRVPSEDLLRRNELLKLHPQAASQMGTCSGQKGSSPNAPPTHTSHTAVTCRNRRSMAEGWGAEMAAGQGRLGRPRIDLVEKSTQGRLSGINVGHPPALSQPGRKRSAARRPFFKRARTGDTGCG